MLKFSEGVSVVPGDRGLLGVLQYEHIFLPGFQSNLCPKRVSNSFLRELHPKEICPRFKTWVGK